MIDPTIIQYIKDERAKGVARDVIAAQLISEGGWNKDDVEAAFTAIETGAEQTLPVSKGGSSLKRIFTFNIFVFLAYTAVSAMGYDYAIMLYMWHVGILLVLFLVAGVATLFFGKKDLHPGAYFLMAMIIAVIGFGSCLFLLSTGMVKWSF